MAQAKARTTRKPAAAKKPAASKPTAKASATRKPVPQPADKGTQAKAKAAAAATAKAKQGTGKVTMAKAFRPTLAGYGSLPGHDVQSAFTLAALVAAGMATLTKEGTLARKEGGNARLFHAVISSASMKGHHTRKGNFDSAGYLTAAGAVHFHNRLTGSASWGKNTAAAVVRSMVPAIQKGGKVEVEYNGGKRTIAFDAEVAVSK